LAKLADYDQAADLETTWETPDLSKLKLWDYFAADTASEKKSEPSKSSEQLAREDEMARLFSPHGAILQVELDQENWLTSGMGPRVPVLVYSSTVLLAKYPDARTVARFADRANLRISGLLWPEARTRIARSSFCTREDLGSGQVILFAAQPNFRAFFRGSERLLVNAVLYGPGLGTSWTPKW
jgi:hypothetical protein